MLAKLFKAVEDNDLKTASELVTSKGHLLSEGDRDEYSAIHVCAARGKADMMNLLLELKADVNSRTRGCYTPSILAASAGNLSCLRVLVEHGADTTLATLWNSDVVDALARNYPRLRDILGEETGVVSVDQDGQILVSGTIGASDDVLTLSGEFVFRVPDHE